tara:strand:+ start:113 stop:1333 length:1221 start_codon:yes stop_codon:yes gene_type:complete
MNKIHLITVFIFSLSFTLNADILIKNGNIYSGDSAPFIGDIYIKDGKIHSIGSLNIKASKEIDAQGKIVTPGFIAPMTLIGIVEINSLDVTRDDESDYLNMGFSIFRAYNPNSTLIPWNRANGITSAISIPQQTSMPLAGMGSYFILDGNMNISGSKDMMMLGRIGASSGSRSEDLDLLENLISLGKLAKNRPYEKVIESPIAVFFELLIQDIEALDKVANEGLPLVIKTNRASDIKHLIDIKNKYKLNMILAGVEDAPIVIDELAASEIPVIINPMDNIPDSFDELSSSLELSAILSNAGITVLFDTSRSHNYHLIRQGAGNAVAYGMDYLDAIAGLSANVANVFDLKDRGSITKGYYADIAIWESDPLEPASIPSYVFINGIESDLTTRSSRLKDRYIKKLDKK